MIDIICHFLLYSTRYFSAANTFVVLPLNTCSRELLEFKATYCYNNLYKKIKFPVISDSENSEVLPIMNARHPI